MDWEMKDTVIIDPDQVLGAVGPSGIALASITPRQ